MDEHGQVGPEKPDYKKDILVTAMGLRVGQAQHIRLAAAMTQYELVITPSWGMTTQHEGPIQQWLYIAKVNGHRRGAGRFALSHCDPDTMADGLEQGPIDAFVISGFFNRVVRMMLDLDHATHRLDDLLTWEWAWFRNLPTPADPERFKELVGENAP